MSSFFVLAWAVVVLWSLDSQISNSKFQIPTTALAAMDASSRGDIYTFNAIPECGRMEEMADQAKVLVPSCPR